VVNEGLEVNGNRYGRLWHLALCRLCKLAQGQFAVARVAARRSRTNNLLPVLTSELRRRLHSVLVGYQGRKVTFFCRDK
jgi:hypothetical protein